ncbi:MAG TPA: hypothetical protein QF753_13915 [Victivallales bacterium]|nr:hypothetical protein [Victivallales bacterium]
MNTLIKIKKFLLKLMSGYIKGLDEHGSVYTPLISNESINKNEINDTCKSHMHKIHQG